MARIRSIHPEACTSERLARVGAEAERCYWRLQTHCDDEGRAEDNARLIWAALFPLLEDVTPGQVDGWLDELTREGLVVRYEVEGRRYLAVTQWGRFQHPQRPKPSKFPAPSATCHGHVRDEAEMDHGHVLPGEGEGDDAIRVVPSPRGSRIPIPYVVAPADQEWAEREHRGVDWDTETKKFVDHFRAKTGRDATKLDWSATWRNWIRRADGGWR